MLIYLPSTSTLQFKVFVSFLLQKPVTGRNRIMSQKASCKTVPPRRKKMMYVEKQSNRGSHRYSERHYSPRSGYQPGRKNCVPGPSSGKQPRDSSVSQAGRSSHSSRSPDEYESQYDEEYEEEEDEDEGDQDDEEDEDEDDDDEYDPVNEQDNASINSNNSLQAQPAGHPPQPTLGPSPVHLAESDRTYKMSTTNSNHASDAQQINDSVLESSDGRKSYQSHDKNEEQKVFGDRYRCDSKNNFDDQSDFNDQRSFVKEESIGQQDDLSGADTYMNHEHYKDQNSFSDHGKPVEQTTRGHDENFDQQESFVFQEDALTTKESYYHPESGGKTVDFYQQTYEPQKSSYGTVATPSLSQEKCSSILVTNQRPSESRGASSRPKDDLCACIKNLANNPLCRCVKQEHDERCRCVQGDIRAPELPSIFSDYEYETLKQVERGLRTRPCTRVVLGKKRYVPRPPPDQCELQSERLRQATGPLRPDYDFIEDLPDTQCRKEPMCQLAQDDKICPSRKPANQKVSTDRRLLSSMQRQTWMSHCLDCDVVCCESDHATQCILQRIHHPGERKCDFIPDDCSLTLRPSLRQRRMRNMTAPVCTQSPAPVCDPTASNRRRRSARQQPTLTWALGNRGNANNNNDNVWENSPNPAMSVPQAFNDSSDTGSGDHMKPAFSGAPRDQPSQSVVNFLTGIGAPQVVLGQSHPSRKQRETPSGSSHNQNQSLQKFPDDASYSSGMSCIVQDIA